MCWPAANSQQVSEMIYTLLEHYNGEVSILKNNRTTTPNELVYELNDLHDRLAQYEQPVQFIELPGSLKEQAE